MKDVNELFAEKKIYIEGNSFPYKNETTEAECINQIRNIIEFQKRLMGYRENIIPRLNSSIGKEIEGFKVSLKKLKRSINMLEDNRDSNISVYFKQNKESLISRSNEAIKIASSDGYHTIIKRSMSRYEVGLGKCDTSNLVINGDEIRIGSIKYMSYNMVEDDMYLYLKRLRKRKVVVDDLKMIKLFINESKLGRTSLKYIVGLLSFPSEEVRLIQRFNNGKLDITNIDFVNALESERLINKAVFESFEEVLNE